MAAGQEQCADTTMRLPRSPPRSLKAAGGDDRTEGVAAKETDHCDDYSPGEISYATTAA